MNCKRFVSHVRVPALALIVLSLACLLGCTQYVYGKYGARWAVKDWEYVRKWMRSSDTYDWGDNFIGFKKDGRVSFEFFFTPSWGSRLMTIDDVNVTNCYCENVSRKCLKISAFPTFANAVELHGAFDVSEADIDKSIEYYYWDEGKGKYNNGNLDVQFPSFPADSKLRCLELELPSMEGCYNYVPVLNLERYADLSYLKKIRIHSYFPLAGIDRLLEKTQLESAEFEMCYQCSDWRPCGVKAEDCTGLSGTEDFTPLRGVFDDESFDELLKVDFSNYDEVDIEINLTKIRRLDIVRLLGDRSVYRVIKIKSQNCVIENLPSVIDYKKELLVMLDMFFDLGGRASEDNFL